SPKTMASAGQVCAQALTISPSLTGRGPSRLLAIFPSWMRCTQYVHFSLTPRMRTGTLGLNCIFRVSGRSPDSGSGEAAGGAALELEVVEAADLVRAVVRAVARADAAVVRHVVEPLGAVRRGVDRADVLARRLFALHAGERLQGDMRIVLVLAEEVAVD